MSKFRKDFVTNSSSSSFICEVSGGSEGGYDMGLSEAGMYECVNGHTFYEHYATMPNDMSEVLRGTLEEEIESYKEHEGEDSWSGRHYQMLVDYMKQLDEEELDDYEIQEILDNEFEFRYRLPASCCPICTMQHITDGDTLTFLLNKFGLSKSEVHDEMREAEGKK